MDFGPILEGSARILSQDLLAIVLVAFLVLVQITIWFRARVRCRAPLREAQRALLGLAERLGDDRLAIPRVREAIHRAYPRLQELWRQHVREVDDGLVSVAPIDLDDAFGPDALLPADYNWRLDAAAPGLFTGLGILGTFIGLILGFLRVNPEVASESVSPLLGGMVVAFLNSAIGVLVSLQWAWSSRVRRHQFDVAAQQFVRRLRKQLTNVTPDDMLLQEIRSLSERMGEVKDATTNSSERLAGILGTQLEQTFSNLVNAPFEQLTNSVQAFESAMRESGAQQVLMQAKLTAGAAALDEARGRITEVVGEIRSVLDDLGIAGVRLQEAVTATQVPLERAGQIAAQTGRLVESLNSAANRQEALTEAMSEATGALTVTSTALSTQAGEYAAATGRLEGAVATIQQATERAVGATVSAAREELQVAIASLRDGLQVDTLRTIRAYEEATGRVIEAVDDKMTDLTDRLSAELATLTSRLPAEVEQVHSAMRLFREQIAGALKSIDEAVRQLRHEAPAVLSRQLDQYDIGLAKAMDHFSGTLQNWNANVESISALAKEMTGLRQVLLDRGDNGAGPARSR